MPLPIRPHPSTPTRPMSVMARSDDLEGLANLVGDAHEGARSGPGDELVPFDVSALQGVEHLLEADLESLVVVAVAARHAQRRRPHRHHRHRRPQCDGAEDWRHGAEGRAHQHEPGRAPEPLSALPARVRDEAHVADPRLELRDLRRDLGGARQREALAACAERPLNRGERADLRLPGGAIGVAPLHLQQLFLLHPGPEGALDRRPLSRHHTFGRQQRRPREPGERAALRGGHVAGLLLEQRLLQIAGRDADVLAQREERVLRQPLPDVALAGLELGRAPDDALERLPADELARHAQPLTLAFSRDAGSVSPEVLSGSAGVAAAARAAAVPKNPLNRSIGIGKIVVELFSEAISVTVWRNRSWIAAGSAPMMCAACASFSEACSSPSALMTLARRSRSASACRAIARFISGGRSTSFTSTADTSIPQSSVRRSMMFLRMALIFSRFIRSSSSSVSPSTERRVVWASWLVA